MTFILKNKNMVFVHDNRYLFLQQGGNIDELVHKSIFNLYVSCI